MKVLNACSRWSVLLIAGLVPLACANLTALGAKSPSLVSQIQLPKLLLLALLVLAGTASLLTESVMHGRALRWHWTGWLVLAGLAAAIASAANSVIGIQSWLGRTDDFQGVLTAALLAALWFLALNTLDSQRRLHDAARSVGIGAAIVVAYATLQVMGADPTNWGKLPFEAGRPFAWFGNPDPFAGYLILPLALSPALALLASRKGERIAWWSLSFACLALIIWSTVRGAWIAALVAVAGCALMAMRAKTGLKPEDRQALIGGAAVLAVVLIAGVTAGAAGTRLQERVSSAFETDSGSVASRLNAWSAAADSIAEEPILGTGPDSFRVVWYRYRPIKDLASSGFQGVSSQAHNHVIGLAATQGIPAAVLWVALVISAVVLSLRTPGKSGGRSLLITGMWGVTAAAYAVYLLTGISEPAGSTLLAIALAAGVSPRARRIGGRVPSVAAFGSAAVVGLASLVVFGMWWSTDAALADARMMPDSERVATFSDSPLASTHPQYELALADLQRDALVSPTRESVDVIAALYSRAAASQPWEHDTYVRWSSFLNAAQSIDPGYVAEAADVARKGIDVYPASLASRVQLAQALYWTDRPGEGADVLEEAWSWDPAVTDPARIFVECCIAAEDPQRATEAAGFLEDTAAGDPDIDDVLTRFQAALNEK